MKKSTFYCCHGKNLPLKLRNLQGGVLGIGVEGAIDGCWWYRALKVGTVADRDFL